MDAQRALLVWRRWWPVIVVGTLLAAGVAYGIGKAQPKVYEATALLQVYPGAGTTGGGGDINEVQAAWYQAADDGRLMDTKPFAQAAIKRVGHTLKHSVNATTLLKNVKVTAAPPSRVIELAVRATDPNDASKLANAIAASFLAYDARLSGNRYTDALAAINQKIRQYSRDEANATLQSQRLARASTLTPAQQTQSTALYQRISVDQGMLAELQSSADGLRLRMAGAGASLSLVQAATPPLDPVSSRTLANTLIGAVLALLILSGLALLLDLVDTRPRTADDLAARLDLPLLAAIRTRDPHGSALAEPASALADDYRGLRTNLEAVVAPPPVAEAGRIVAVTGAQPGDGATTVAVNLAALAARAGSRAVLVDANWRRPALQALLGVSDGGGLAALLRGDGDPLALLQESGLPGLRVLVAGPTSVDAVDLLASARLSRVLAALRAASDLVVIDTAGAVPAETAALAQRADATLLVARLHGAGPEALESAAGRLRQAGARLAGVVVMLGVAPQPAVHEARRKVPALSVGGAELSDAKRHAK